jgi:hypothetical protein
MFLAGRLLVTISVAPSCRQKGGLHSWCLVPDESHLSRIEHPCDSTSVGNLAKQRSNLGQTVWHAADRYSTRSLVMPTESHLESGLLAFGWSIGRAANAPCSASVFHPMRTSDAGKSISVVHWSQLVHS